MVVVWIICGNYRLTTRPISDDSNSRVAHSTVLPTYIITVCSVTQASATELVPDKELHDVRFGTTRTRSATLG